MESSHTSGARLERLKQRYQLKLNPFSPLLDHFFEGAQRQHNLETIRHLASFGDLVLLLTGVRGMGKSTLLQELNRQGGEELEVVLLSAEDINGSFAETLCAHLGMTCIENEPFNHTLDRILQHMDAAYERGDKRYLLAFDQAESLPPVILKSLLASFTHRPQESGGVLLLAGEPQLISRVEKQAPELSFQDDIHQIQLKPLGEEDIQEYLQQRMALAGYQSSFSVSEEQARLIVEYSNGNPGLVSRFAPAILLDEVEQAPEKAGIKFTPSRMLLVIVALLLLSLAFVASRYDLDDGGPADRVAATGAGVMSDPADKNQLIEQQAHSAIAERIERQEALLKSRQQDLPRKPEVSGEAPPLKPAERRPLEDSSEGSLPDSGKESPATAIANPPELDKAALVDPVSNAKKVVTVSKPKPKPVAVAKPKPKPKPGDYRSNAWLGAQTPSDYTIQLLGGYQKSTAESYIRSHKGKLSNLYYVKSTLKGKTWYVVLLGQYSSKAAAHKALASSPASVRKLQPWVRSFKGLQEAMSR